jgi:hypothetical protein
MTRIVLALLLVLLIVPQPGCKKSAEEAAEKAIEKAIESEGGQKADVDVSEGKIKITAKEEGQEYSMEIAAEGDMEMPGDIPGDIPIYPEAKLLSSMKAGADHQRLVLESEDDSRVIYEFYLGKLEKEGWEIVQDMKMPPMYSVMATKGDRQANLVVNQGDGKSNISIGWMTSEG